MVHYLHGPLLLGMVDSYPERFRIDRILCTAVLFRIPKGEYYFIRRISLEFFSTVDEGNFPPVMPYIIRAGFILKSLNTGADVYHTSA